MQNHSLTRQKREHIAEFIALSAVYIGVEAPSVHTFARWTQGCLCQPARAKTDTLQLIPKGMSASCCSPTP